ncbi:MAG TPA: FISUMP domain-containing protein [Bacteroidales bacterium]|nr:FISUMP domain-containing protein [Bacteroidales bacterium]
MKKNQYYFNFVLLHLILLAIFLLQSCDKNKITILTKEVKDVNQISAKCTGQVSDNEKIIEKGFCWDTLSSPTIDHYKLKVESNSTTYSGIIRPLKSLKTYYIRAYAMTESSVFYGNMIQITTLNNTFVDPRDGRNYKMITIGTQTWMAENLNTIKYNDGTDIPQVTNPSSWNYIETPAYCWYENNQELFGETYGPLYNWYSVNTGKLCPLGWHVPSDSEWSTLVNYCGGDQIAGNKLKEIKNFHWSYPNTGADNESGFTALPGGFRDYNGDFITVNLLGYWWCSSEGGDWCAWYRYMHKDFSNVIRVNENKKRGLSVRCVKDENLIQ